MSVRTFDLDGVHLIDLDHMGMPGTVGSYLLPGAGGRFALVEAGPASTLSTLEAGVRALGFAPEGLTDVLLTHIHLDHAAGAGTLARRYGATVHVHERGAPHLVDPSKLIASAERIYRERMHELWGDMEAVPEPQVRPLRDGDVVTIDGRSLHAVYTPGHASHHVAYRLEDGSVFSGDAAAIRLEGSQVVRPALPPPEVDLEAWEASLDRLRELRPRRLLLTHFGEVTDVEAHIERVRRRNRLWAEAILEGMRAGEDEGALEERIRALGDGELRADGASPEMMERHRASSNYEMTVMGVTRYWRKHHPDALDGSG